MVNMDMIGRNDPNGIGILCKGKNEDVLYEASRKASERVGIILKELDRDYSTSSDHGSFFRGKIPFVFYCDGGGSFAHNPADTWNKLSPAKMGKVPRLCFLTVSELANQE